MRVDRSLLVLLVILRAARRHGLSRGAWMRRPAYPAHLDSLETAALATALGAALHLHVPYGRFAQDSAGSLAAWIAGRCPLSSRALLDLVLQPGEEPQRPAERTL